MQNVKNVEKLGKAPVGRLLLWGCIHSSAALFVYGIYNITDMLIISRGVNETAAGAIAVVSPLMLILNAVSTTMGGGGAALLSKALGKNDLRTAAKITANVLIVFWTFALSVTVTGLLFLTPVLKALGVTSRHFPYAKDYAAILLLGAVTSTAFSSLIRAEGDMRYALKIWLIPVMINLALDCLFVFCFRLSIRGAALATVISQITSVLMYIWFFFIRPDKTYEIKRSSFHPDFKMIQAIVRLGLPSLIAQLSSGVSLVLVNKYLGLYSGAMAITCMGFAMKIQTFLIMPQNGILQGMQPLLSYNYSGGQMERVKETLKKSVILSSTYGLFAAGAVFLFGEKLLTVFTSDKSMISFGGICLTCAVITASLKNYSPLIATFYQSVGDAGKSLTVIIGSVIVRILTITIMANLWKTEGILWSFIVVDILTFLLTAVFRIATTKRKDVIK